eukprot:TRINITY_DN37216_c0_g1_i1.p1 TRINITY_DN37216_c0_g1~~TRINITY_DN37216_c0_g1_i1.p1  ORF type:complete len:369 (-),score=94.58 TRINITY_DN37216_c0_g1_i1:69-1121(-)
MVDQGSAENNPGSGNESKPCTPEEVLACAFPAWYDDFKDYTVRSRIIDLPEEVVRYLNADGIRVPAGRDRASGSDDDGSNWGEGSSDSDDSGDEADPNFPEFEAAVAEAIRELGGEVLPKLNWSAPKDARWVLGTLKCQSVQDVLLLLKASDFVAHDLSHAFDDCEQVAGAERRSRPDNFTLVLREWCDVDEANEFRCFVDNGRLVAVSQRHSSLFFPHLAEVDFVNAVRDRLDVFFQERILGTFPLQRFACDVTVGKPPRRKVRLLDFSPWTASTDPLLFDWEELQEMGAQQATQESGPPVIRTVGSESERRAKLENYHALPLEVAELGAKSPEEISELCRKAEATLRT